MCVVHVVRARCAPGGGEGGSCTDPVTLCSELSKALASPNPRAYLDSKHACALLSRCFALRALPAFETPSRLSSTTDRLSYTLALLWCPTLAHLYTTSPLPPQVRMVIAHSEDARAFRLHGLTHILFNRKLPKSLRKTM